MEIKGLKPIGYKFTHFNSKYAIYFTLSVVAFIAVIAISPQWCWVPLPFLCTYFVEMFGWIR